MVSQQGTKCVIFVHPWSVMVSIASYPFELGNLVMKSSATTSNGVVLSWGYMGCSGAFVGRLLTLCRWHSPHPRTYSATSRRSPGHQYPRSTKSTVLAIPGCP